MARSLFCIVILVLFSGCAHDPAPATANAPKVILIVGDGLDDQQITIARNYLVGAGGRLQLDEMPYRGVAQVQTVDADNPDMPVYVGDSASGGTAMATGVATSEGRIGVTADASEPLTNIMELSIAAGLRTGIVTTARVTDASPASFIAHMSSRYCQAPGDMVAYDPVVPQDSTDCSAEYVANGGPGSIVEQVAASNVDILLGGGADDFMEFAEGSESVRVLDAAMQNGFSVVRTPTELDQAGGSGKLLGLFATGHLPERLRGQDGRKAEYLERVDGKIVWPEPFACEDNPAFDGIPDLAGMTRAALARFSDDGFMLLVESASIDKAAHYWRPCGHIGEMGQLDDTLRVALEYADAHPETLVLVTADHGSSAQLIPQISGLAPQGFGPTGRFARIATPEGGIMGIGYATNDSTLWEEHSGVQIPVYASGPGVDVLPEYLLQTDIFRISAAHLGLADR